MSWIDDWIPLATGLLQELFEEDSEPESHDCASSTGNGYDFGQHICALAGATGIRLLRVNECRASFALVFEQETYITTAVHVEGIVHFTVFSKVEFPLHGVPVDVVQAVAGVNGRLPKCEFELLDLDDVSVWCAQAAVDATERTTDAFVTALTQLATCVARLDAWMVEDGFAP